MASIVKSCLNSEPSSSSSTLLVASSSALTKGRSAASAVHQDRDDNPSNHRCGLSAVEPHAQRTNGAPSICDDNGKGNRSCKACSNMSWASCHLCATLRCCMALLNWNSAHVGDVMPETTPTQSKAS
eukprot:CAMPEP_0180799314 /NCGR_PEP_ID=MMETSP1038_2-20121128/58471_1 /TAXON_ID=632150 /ORGANISM="Azadinium spinosum, Strain 3D9" /LENGTH=126 /DNA_ID=CAMNT_0022838901 /DNA_START=27 /DNA_END=403 /DNA_ORIENTATION=-